MKKLVVLFGVLCVSLSFTAFAAPKTVNAEYEVRQNGSPIAKVKESFTQTGDQYQITSVTKGIGIYALMGERKMTSQGTVTAKGLKPSVFEITQSSSAKKHMRDTFDWSNNTLTIEAKGETRQEALTPNMQDMLSAVYQLMWAQPKSGTLEMVLTNGKKLSQQHYQVTSKNPKLQTEAGNFDVIKMQQTDGDKVFYLAKKTAYLPIKVVMQDDGKTMEQVLQRISIK